MGLHFRPNQVARQLDTEPEQKQIVWEYLTQSTKSLAKLLAIFEWLVTAKVEKTKILLSLTKGYELRLVPECFIRCSKKALLVAFQIVRDHPQLGLGRDETQFDILNNAVEWARNPYV